MSPALRTALVVIGAFAAVVLASVFYSRVLRQAPVETASRPTPGVAADAPPLHPGIEAGLRALKDNRLDEARTSFESVPASDPSYFIARGQLASALLRAGDARGSVRVLEELAALQPDSPEIAERLAWGYYRLGDPERAELNALRGVEIDGTRAQLRYAVGLFRLAAGRTIEAVPAYKRAMEADTGRRNVGDALMQLFTLGAERPDLPGVHYVAAFFANAMQRPELERQELERFLEAESSGPLAANARAQLLELGPTRSASPDPSP